MPLSEANQARHFIEHQLELGLSAKLTEAACHTVEGYNEDDCRATAGLREWLESLRTEIVAGGKEIARPEAKEMAASENVAAHLERVALSSKR